MQAPAWARTSSAAGAGETSTKPNAAVATLKVIEDGVSVRRKGKDEFKPARDGQKLRVGDTVKTDGTGFAQINYTDAGDTFTRLDVDTEFTIVSLTDDQGNRKIDGSLDLGRTWNRTTALTESESFQQEGAGATAAVTGSAYLSDCVSPGNCVFTSVVDNLIITTVDGEVKILDPLQQCDSTEITDTDSNLCNVPEDVALEILLADKFIAENFFLDGLGGYPLPVVGTVEVEGTSVTFTPADGGGSSNNSAPPGDDDAPSPVAGSVSVDLDPASIVADGSSTSTATATVRDTNNQLLAGQNVSFSTDGDVTFGAVTDHNNGTYTATVTSSQTADSEEITAAVGSVHGSATLTETEVPEASAITLSLSPGTIPADDGTTSTTATATVYDQFNQTMTGQTVTFTKDSSPVAGPVTDHGDGTYTVAVPSASTAGNKTITAAIGSVSDSATLVETEGVQPSVVTSVTVSLNPTSIPADNGTSSTTATATVLDQYNQPMTGQTVTFTKNGNAVSGSVTDHGDGTYSITVPSSSTAGTKTITATAGSVQGSALLDETSVSQPSTVGSVKLQVASASMPADGTSTTPAKVTVKDTNGNLLSGQSVSITASGDMGISGVTDNGDGTYSATLTASCTPGSQQVTATVGSFHDTKNVNLRQPGCVTVRVASSSAGGTASTSVASAPVADDPAPAAVVDEPEPATEPEPAVEPDESETDPVVQPDPAPTEPESPPSVSAPVDENETSGDQISE